MYIYIVIRYSHIFLSVFLLLTVPGNQPQVMRSELNPWTCRGTCDSARRNVGADLTVPCCLRLRQTFWKFYGFVQHVDLNREW